GMDLTMGDGERLHEQVWHVPRHDADLRDRALAAQAHKPGRKVDAIGRTNEKQHRRVYLVGIDQQPERVAGPILLAIWDDLEVIEPERGSVEPLSQDREQVASL